MGQIGRNDPCPCGSGKKYKRCCLGQETTPKRQGLYTALKRQPQEPVDSPASAVIWLMERYPPALIEAYGLFFAASPEAMLAQIKNIAGTPRSKVLPCLHEWLIGDASFNIENTMVRASELLLGPDGPLFTANEQRHVEELAASTLSMYEVLEVHQGEGLLLQDLLQADEAPFFAHGVQVAETLVCWDITGLRILRQQDKCTIADGIYAFERDAARALVRLLAKTISKELKNKCPPATLWEVVTKTIIGTWLISTIAPQSKPKEQHGQSHELLPCIKDRYQISNWEALKEILDNQDGVQWDDDDKWLWGEVLDEQLIHNLVSLTYLPPAVLEVECSSTEDADAARKWLENLAAPHISHLERLSGQKPSPRQNPFLELPNNSPERGDLPLEKAQEMTDKVRAAWYEKWLHKPQAALSGNAVLQASSHPTDRARILEALKCFERNEARCAKSSGIKAFDLAFLWKRLGFERY